MKKLTFRLRFHIALKLITGDFSINAIEDSLIIPVPKKGYPSIKVKLNYDDYH